MRGTPLFCCPASLERELTFGMPRVGAAVGSPQGSESSRLLSHLSGCRTHRRRASGECGPGLSALGSGKIGGCEEHADRTCHRRPFIAGRVVR